MTYEVHGEFVVVVKAIVEAESPEQARELAGALDNSVQLRDAPEADGTTEWVMGGMISAVTIVDVEEVPS